MVQLPSQPWRASGPPSVLLLEQMSSKDTHCVGDALGGIKLNHDPFSAIKQPSTLDPEAERETDLAQLPSQPQAACGPATELTQDPDVDMVDTENQPDRYSTQGHGKQHAVGRASNCHVIVIEGAQGRRVSGRRLAC